MTTRRKRKPKATAKREAKLFNPHKGEHENRMDMTNIKALKNEEMQEVIDFYHFIEEYGHIFYDDPAVLD
jgi:hypothetical protein